MKALIKASEIEGAVLIPASKSVAHRVLIASAMANCPTKIVGKFASDDIYATIDCIISLGATVTFEDDGLTVFPIMKTNRNPIINVRESGSTLRFLLPICQALDMNTTIIREGTLKSRPIGKMVSFLKKHDVMIEEVDGLLRLCGKIKGYDFEIDASESSQYITGVLFAMVLLNHDSCLALRGNVVSESYIKTTLSVLRDFGITVESHGNSFFVKGGQKLISPKTYFIEGDWSSASFFAVAGCLSGSVTLKNLKLNSSQADKVIIDVLQNMGAKIDVSESQITVNRSDLQSLEFDITDCPDIAPILAIAMANAKGESIMYGTERLRIKESDRLSEITAMLCRFGIDVKIEKGCLRILGGKLRHNTFMPASDHRMIMSIAVGALVAEGETEIQNADAVSKSYDCFFDDFKKIGGNVDVFAVQ